MSAYIARYFPAPDYFLFARDAGIARHLALPSIMWSLMLAMMFVTLGIAVHLGIQFRGFELQGLAIGSLLVASIALAIFSGELITRVRILLEAIAFVFAGAILGRYLSYELQMFAAPLQDANFTWLDRKLGFDYLADMIALDDHPLVCKVLHAAYYSFRYQIAGTVLAFAVRGYLRTLAHFLLALFLSLCMCAIISAILPAIGAVTLVDHGLTFHQLTFDGATPVAHLDALRAGNMHVLNLPQLGGIITFPSFHVVIAVLVTYAWRSLRLFIAPVLALNVLMIVSAMSQGGHYLVDCIAGAAVAAVAIVGAYALIGWRLPSVAMRPTLQATS